MSTQPLDTGSKPLRSDARRNRERVLESARACFGRDGLDAQMDDIAARAGVGVGTVYRHFETKEALLEALAADHFSRLAALAEEAEAVEDPWEAFAGFIRAGAELMAADRGLAEISAERPEVMNEAALKAAIAQDFFGRLERVITRAREAGQLRPEFELEDIPGIMCSIGSVQVSSVPYSNWRRLLAILLDGLRGPGGSELPPVLVRLPGRDV
jgi:AcrR family transcriptional regulator